MDPLTITLVAVSLLVVLIIVGFPIGYSLAAAPVIMSLIIGDAGSVFYVANDAFSGLDSIGLIALPMFILMGSIITISPAGSDIYRFLERVIPIPGGLGLSALGSCSLFSAISGSSPATVAAVGSSSVPEMISRGYSKRLSCGIVSGGATLGILIPPSIVLLLYGIVTKTSIGKLFIAGILPGLLVVGLFALYISYAIFRDTKKSQKNNSGPSSDRMPIYKERESISHSFFRVAPFFIMMIVIMYALYGGWATPTEVAAVGASASFFLVCSIYKVKDWSAWKNLFIKSVTDTSMIMIIASFSYLFSTFIAFHGGVSAITDLLTGGFSNQWVTLSGIWLLMIFLGLFLPPFAIVVIVAPIFLPFIIDSGFDPIWFGVFIVLNMEIGCITPPLGINLFVLKSVVPEVSLKDILMGSIPFILLLMLSTVIITVFPKIVTFLPSLM